MKRLILIVSIILSFPLNSQIYVNGEKVADHGSSDISIVDGDVYIDGKSIDELTREANIAKKKKDLQRDIDDLHKQAAELEEKVYRTKNVDSYNKWYNTKGKKMIEEKHKKQKRCILIILGSIGAVTMFIGLGFVFAEIRKRIKDYREKRSLTIIKTSTSQAGRRSSLPPATDVLGVHPDIEIPEVLSTIKKK